VNERWINFLSQTDLADFGSGASGSANHASIDSEPQTLVCDLSSDYQLIAFAGPDAVPFLHGQLSNDVQALTPDTCQYSAYHSPKGRVLATMLLWLDGDGVYAQVPTEVAEGLHKRLSMYVLRSKVKATLAGDRYIRMGLGGAGAAAILDQLSIRYPAKDLGLHRTQSVGVSGTAVVVDRLLRLPGHRYEILLSDADAAVAVWRALQQAGAAPARPTAWRWLTVRSGVAEILAKTQDQFVAQMLNLELTGAISFTKGCYPGQEIVARAQYRGAVKRRTFLVHTEDSSAVTEGDPVYGADPVGQEVGTVVLGAPAPRGGADLLACLHVDLARSGPMRLGRPDGPPVELRDLPYKLPAGA